MRRPTKLVSTAIAIAAGFIVLAGYLLPPLLPPTSLSGAVLAFLRDQMIRWAVIVAAFAFILGFFNILRVHLKRITRGGQNAFYSGLLILTAMISLGLTIVGLGASSLGESTVTATLSSLSAWWFDYVLSPLQASAAGLIAVTLTVAAFRLFRGRRNGGSFIFLAAAVLVLLGTLPLPGQLGASLVWLREQLVMNTLAVAGVRGLLIGVGLGTLLMGLRIIVGLDRPHTDM